MDKTDKLLESTCKTMIKAILTCLDNATKGTIYRVGPMPDLSVVRVTSGLRKSETDDIAWGLPAFSDYNPPGKSWMQYRDQPDRALEAMGWCVEKQKSWTAENPLEDARSVRKQILGEAEDFYHMEPVLVKKTDMFGCSTGLPYPLDWQENPIWQDSDYVVAAVIKIHFKPGTIRRDDRTTRIIRELAGSLGTELLSLYLHEMLSRARRDFARQRLQSCEILAHELRNTLVKMGFVFSAINAQVNILRESWESLLRSAVPDLEWKGAVLDRLSVLLQEKLPELEGPELRNLAQTLLKEQKDLRKVSLTPYLEQEWVRNKIQPRWEKLLATATVWDKTEIELLLSRLLDSLRTGMGFDLAGQIEGLPSELAKRWAKLAYVYITSNNLFQMDEVIQLVEEPALPVPHKEQILRVLKSLKALVLTIPEVEEKATRILQSLRYGTWAEDQNHADPCALDWESNGELGIALSD